MSWIEYFFIVLGASLDIFAVMECQGSLVQKVNKKQLLGTCVIFVAFQLIAMFIGYFIANFINMRYSVADEALLGEIISIVILLGLGTRLIIKAAKNERIEEIRQSGLKMGYIAAVACMTAGYTMLAGIAFGFLNTGLVLILVMLAILSVVSIVAGMYTGYHFGFEQKTKVYVVGAIIFIAAGVDVVIRLLSMN